MKKIKIVGIIALVVGLCIGSAMLIMKYTSKPVLNSDKENIVTVPYKESKNKPEISNVPKDNAKEPVTIDKLVDETGRIGTLTISSIGVSSPVYKSDDNTAMEAMSKGIAHFWGTSPWEGNVGLSAHNINMDNSNGIFLNLHKLKSGDKIGYETSEGAREYQVETIKEIEETDWSMFAYTDDNRLTLLTCIKGQPTKRLAVQARLIKNG